MLRWGIIVSAVAAYLVVLLLVVRPNKEATSRADGAYASSGAPGQPLVGLPYRSVSMQIQRVDWIDRYKESIDKIADLGADTVMLVVDSRMENGSSSHIFLDLRTTPTVEQLSDLIDKAKSRKLRVILMPIVLLDKPKDLTEWRGNIKPESWEDWFDSYRDMMTHFSSIAVDHHADVLVIGSELVSTEKMADQWTRTIGAVRAIFKGQLTYSSNWDHYASIPFWNQLDLVGMNSYWKFAKDEEHPPSVNDIVGRWREIQTDLIPWLKKVNKPLLFTEVGWFSQSNVAYEPWDYTKDKPLDMDLQKRLYEGFFQAWLTDPQISRYLGGFNIWEWPPGDGSGADRTGYTPQGKPAEKVLREWLAKPHWVVN